MALADRIREEIESNVADEFDPTVGHSPDFADYSGVTFEETQIEQEPGGDWYEFDWVDESLNTEYYHHIQDEWASLLSNKRFLGVDGGSTRVERDRVHYIDARAGYASTDTTADPVQKVEELDRNQSFFLIDKAIADEDATVYEQIIDFLVYVSDTIFWTTWDSDSDPQNQSLGIEVKLRTLTELNAIRKISHEYDSSDVDFVLKDGSIYPTSVKAVRSEEERVHEDDRDVLDTLKEMEENDFLVVGLVKRISTAAFAQEMAKLREDIDSDRFNDDYTFLQGFLQPMQRTPYFIYNPKGAKRVEEERWKPVCTCIKTRQNEVFRVEIPKHYMSEKGIHEDIVEYVFALSEKNHGSIPVPVDNADDYFEIGLREEQRMGSMIDELFEEEKNISLHPPYGGIV